MSRFSGSVASISPLERFVRDYVELREGAWDEVEPQVYDVLVGSEMLRIAFDPEALPEHPQAQLASFGSPALDRMLRDAAERGSFAKLHLLPGNLHPHDLESRVRRAISLTEGLSLNVERARAMSFAQAVFWFEATFASDQKEQEILLVAMDMHYCREVRQIESLLNFSRLAAEPAMFLPEARRCGLRAAHRAAQQRVLRTAAAMANAKRRELAARTERQIGRMIRYYGQLRTELEEQARHAGPRGGDMQRYAARREAIAREEQLRVAELKCKSTMRLHLRLSNVLVIAQPKLLVTASIASRRGRLGALELVWDPLAESVEAALCPRCNQPTFSFSADRTGHICCQACVGAALSARAMRR